MRSSIVRATVVVAALAAVLLALVPAAAQAQATPSNLKVTIAARFCDQYTDIFANRARNNIMESLKDLGPNTPYGDGEPINPGEEDRSPQSRCKPLPQWTFTLGKGYRSRAVAGPWGSLSIVTSPFASPGITTQAQVPLLNQAGQDTGDTIQGATTITLTQEQANIAARPNALWIQGGTPTDPILNTPYPGEYGFGALRCAIDNLNGDNVEWISYPQGARHVFCYAYYVKPPPTSGTIIVRKEVVNVDPQTASQAFRFTGNISFAADDSFTLNAAPSAPGSITFYRAEVGQGTPPWTFAEQVPPGWQLAGPPTCTSATGKSVAAITGATTAVSLAASDTVTCTYRNELEPPPPGQLEIAKISSGGVGRFPFSVTGPSPFTTSLMTTEPGVPVSTSREVQAGDYAITEDVPEETAAGVWKLAQVRCGGRIVEDIQPVRVSIAPGQGVFCAFGNTFTPNGTIRIRKKTIGAVGTTGFVITPTFNETVSYEQSATTKEQNVAVLATGDKTTSLALGTYVIQETTPSEPTPGYWTLDSLVCNDQPVATDQGRTTITLSAAVPDIDCTFTNRFTKGAEPPTPPTPDNGGDVDPSDRPLADIAITKTVRPTRARVGQLLTFTIKITNRGPDAAEDVTGVEVNPGGTTPLSVKLSKGTCGTSRPITCRLGTLKKGETVTGVVTNRVFRAGTYVNRVATNTATNELNTRNNTAQATVRIVRRPSFTG